MDVHTCSHTHMYACMHAYIDTHKHLLRSVYIHTYICCTGVVYDNISVMFMLWALSINNKVGLVLFANIYLRHQSVVICRRWLYSVI